MSPIHAACLEINGNGLLVVGKGGSGKSTLAVDAISRGLRILGDDVLWVKVGNQTARAYATSKLLKLSNIDNSISKFFEMTGTTNDKGKQLFYVKPEFENQFLPEITLKFGITLNFSSTHKVERLEKQQFLQKLLPSTVTKFSDPGIGIRMAKNLADNITLNSISLVESRFSNIDSLIDVFG